METRGSQDVVTGFAELHERLTQALFVVCGCHNEVISNLVDSLISAVQVEEAERIRVKLESCWKDIASIYITGETT